MTRRKPSVHKGVLLVDKPEGPTSHDAVRAARRSLGERRIGHTGTLDPFATGLLILLVGPATRLAETFNPLEKEYTATLRLGEETDTADRMGEVTASKVAQAGTLDCESIEKAMATQVGILQQVPPGYSAKKVAGESAHRRLRRGETVELGPAEVTVHSMAVTRCEPPEVDFTVTCSTGTYIRAIARDVGRTLEVGGHLTALRRTRIGPYSVDEALSWEQLEDPAQVNEGLAPTGVGLVHLDSITVTDEESALLQSGRPIPCDESLGRGPVLAVHAGSVLSVGKCADSLFSPKKVFPDGA